MELSTVHGKGNRVVVEGNFIVLNGHYDIEKSRCDSPAKILEWVDHLSEKNWVDKELLRDFIAEAALLNNLEIYQGV